MSIQQRGETELADRLRGAIWGQLVGDAACLGTHWIYDLDQLAAQFPEPRGFEPPAPGHYHAAKKPGEQTHYGDAALVMLDSVARLGRFDPADFGAQFIRFFATPEYRGYLDGATRGTLENYRRFAKEHSGEAFDYQQGADDDQLATATRLAPVVVAHRSDPDLLNVVERATRVCQNNGRAVAAMKANALILKAALDGADPRDMEGTLEEIAARMPEIDPEFGPEVQGWIRAALANTQSVVEATLEFGQSCPLPHSFPAALHAALKHRHSFEDAILSTLRAGGDNAGRAALLGAWLGAYGGVQGIPEAWRNRLAAASIIHLRIEELLAHPGISR